MFQNEASGLRLCTSTWTRRCMWAAPREVAAFGRGQFPGRSCVVSCRNACPSLRSWRGAGRKTTAFATLVYVHSNVEVYDDGNQSLGK